ncbi:cupredoxin domain-containing protein [Methylomonas fluvii]|uniref:Multicopper oxidase n=1 Tax=Methylomonas fluvii TaxID=1854564 RepID=A0ABR9DG58_9GAMM|nr:cupredoxin domain-containing protein [Methylomonas fluvii]MBD9361751.1 hypothetical protein [Methylomonas fluvii]
MALEQIITFNRFGAFNPAGMVYALRQDVVYDDPSTSIEEQLPLPEAAKLDDPAFAKSIAGRVSLRSNKRPRPLVLRVNEGNCLQVKFWNLLAPLPENHSTFVRADFPRDKNFEPGKEHYAGGGVQRHSVQVTESGDSKATDISTPPRDPKLPNSFPFPREEEPDYPTTRAASIHVNGLDYVAIRPEICKKLDENSSTSTVSEQDKAILKASCKGAGKNMGSDGANVGNNPNSLVEPGQHTTYVWFARQEGGYFMYSAGALAGGEGDGGQLGLGLFGSINVEPKGSVWYRSQVTHDELVAAAGGDSDYSHIDYPRLAIVKDGVIQHSDLNAVIYQTDKTSETPEVCSLRSPGSSCGMSFREFTTIFHDENKVFQAFAELSDESNPISRIADGMAINYGASGVGSAVLANLKKIGPGKDCPECKLEEFFLSSWVNGDPAMIVRRDQDGHSVEALYADDPSNVHHSYLGDPVRFRNIHAGPKETHVFHLHAHQWLQDKNDPNANYLDSQTISPGSSYTYDIQYGGGGNRNLTVGDAIFHCHLYPHFAAGMWELWRNHDVFEDGKPGYFDPKQSVSAKNDPRMRNLPDNELKENGSPNPAIVPIPGFALAPLPTADLRGYPFFIAGEVGHRPPQPPMDMAVNDNASGADEKWLDGGLPRHVILEGSNKQIDLNDPNEVKRLIESHGDKNENKSARYVAHRVWKLNSDPNNLGLDKEVETATLRILPQCGTKEEILAMAFHAGWEKKTILGLKSDQQPANMPHGVWQACQDEFKQVLANLSDDSLQWTLKSEPTQWPVKRLIHNDGEDPKSPLTPMNPLWNGLGYQSTKESDPVDQTANPAFDSGKHFRVNGLPPAQGAPFADPCPSQYFGKSTDANSAVEVNRSHPRIYKSAYIQFDMTVNKYGWHDPQARMPVLEQDAAKTLDGTRLAEPLFFRANSGDCIQFQATNLIPSVLNLDDFQVYTPTDTIGQHIHLVKFDVTSSDGSANGWNYEDGTFSPDEVRERIDASHKGKVVYSNDDQPHPALTAKTHPMFKAGGSMESKAALGTCATGSEQKDHPWCGAQTTVQRWWADPVLNDKWDDRTMRAVFTHDHYGPSSHQQHGFYAALVVEPKDSVWAKLNSAPDAIDSQQGCNDQTLGGALKNGACRSDGGPTSYAANIVYPKDYPLEQLKKNKQNVRREYNLAFADFAILYNADLRPVNPPSRQADLMLPHVVRDGLKPKPEGISAEDPGTRLLNYRNEPIPLRVGGEDADSLEYRQKTGAQGDMANIFSSLTHRDSTADPGNQQAWTQTADQHAAQRLKKLLANVPNEIDDQVELKAIIKRGEERRRQFVKNLYLQEPWRDSKGGDPSTPVLAAYEGDPLQLHLIQGAQEEQHVFSMQGMKWLAEPHAPNSGYMNGQQLGISEHFEFDTLVSVPRASVSDYWLGSPAVENLWDGMWGMLRAHGPVGAMGSPAKIDGLARLPDTVVTTPPLVSGDGERLPCPSSDAAAKKNMYLTAWRVSQIKNLFYNNRPTFAIDDPNAIAFFEVPESVVVDSSGGKTAWNNGQKILDYLKQKYVTDNQPIEPLVLRANAGDCVDIQFKNYLPKIVENMDGKHVAAGSESYNLMPPIVNGFNFNQLQMSSRIGLVPQLVAENMPLSEGSNVGLNPRQTDSPMAQGCQIAGDEPFKECDKDSSELVSLYRWYMGDQKVLSKSEREALPCGQACIDQEIKDATKPDGEQVTGYIRYTPMEFGAVSIRSFGDVIKHSSHGLVGALVVEPLNATYSSSANTVADISTPSGEKFKEFVLVVQDDLSLRQHHQPMPNHRMADDAEDTGQKGFNYRTEPLWARNGLGTSGADFNVLNAVDYTNTLSSLHSNPGCQGPCGDPQTPVFSAKAGESVRFRIVHPGGHSRQHAFVLYGHNWDYQPWINASTRLFERDDSTPESEKPKTMRLGAIGGIGPTRHVNILTRAGGEFATPGDYLFRVQEQFQFQGGMWGIFRVKPK